MGSLDRQKMAGSHCEARKYKEYTEKKKDRRGIREGAQRETDRKELRVGGRE